MTEDKAYGNMVSMDDATLFEAPQTSQEQQENLPPGLGNALWSYHNEHRINGIPVAEEDAHLKIDRDDMLAAVFTLDRKPMSAVLYVAPGSEGSDEYDKLLARAYAGDILVVDEIKQFDAAAARFVVWVRYDEVRYVLHPRFKYLREE